MKRHILRIFLILVLLAALCIPTGISVSAKQPNIHVELPFVEEGTLKGADYRISVPEEWNGTLLVFAHGYATVFIPPVRITPGMDPLTEVLLLDGGYALAGSSFTNPGWAIREGIENTKELVNYFKQRVGKPEHVIVWGESLGAGVALKCIEKYPGIFDGAVSEGGPIAGLPMQADWGLGLRLAYDVAFGWPEEDWGPLGDAKDGIDLMEFFIEIGNVYPSSTIEWEFISRVTGFPVDALWMSGPWGAWPVIAYMFFTVDIATLEQRAGGTVMQNLDHVYSLTATEIADLVGLGMDPNTINDLLEEMNEMTDIEASNPARKYLERYFEFSGNIKGPVITIHNTGDPLCIVAHTGVYRNVVEEAGKGELLFQVFSHSVGHCSFTKDQYVLTVNTMKEWLEGTLPDPTAAEWLANGLDPYFDIPSWPFAE